MNTLYDTCCQATRTGIKISPPDCEPPFQLIHGSCLFVNNVDTGSWEEMRDICILFGGDLAKIDSADLLDDLIRFIEDNNLNNVHYWIGATDTDHENYWKWTDLTPVTLGARFWAVICPGHNLKPHRDNAAVNCALMDAGYYYMFSDYYCDGHSASLPVGMICQM
ncbi:C-type lectin-like 29 [Homarus americanus]|uniref:C-type lectin-like 29 n=1 Tax=Homarus americanus TaxID=6706 RepID=A0A8J5MWB3_HOMAM|nr:C-type lectin-like 29 [Homarus americanus]